MVIKFPITGKGKFALFPFFGARPRKVAPDSTGHRSVSPLLRQKGSSCEVGGLRESEGGESEDIEGGPPGNQGERIALPEEGEFTHTLVDPKLRTKEEIDRHVLIGHEVCRNWYRICVQARGREMDHTSQSGKERKLLGYAFDYCFPGDELGFKLIVWAGKERSCQGWMATTVPTKGGVGRFGADKMYGISVRKWGSRRGYVRKNRPRARHRIPH